MKVRIISENNSIKFIAKKDIFTNELLKSIKNNPSLNLNNKEFLLMDKNQKILQSDEIITISAKNNSKEQNNFNIELSHNDKIQPELILYLIPFESANSKKYESVEEFNSIKRSDNKKTDITDLIMKTTNAKEKISDNLFKNKNSIPDRTRIFDFLNSNLDSLGNASSLPGNNSSANHLNELLNILRPMIDNEGGIGLGESGIPNIPRRISRPQVNVVPDENLINNLKEMGFPEEQCRRALIQSRNDISRATDLLLSDGLDYLPSEK
jgi:hypothetical protein